MERGREKSVMVEIVERFHGEEGMKGCLCGSRERGRMSWYWRARGEMS